MDLEKVLRSKLSLRVIRFFNDNVQCIDTVQGIASWTDLSLDKAQNTIKNLVEHNILVEHKSKLTKAYSLTQDRKVISKIQEILGPGPSESIF